MADGKSGSNLIKAAGGVAWRPGPDGRPQILLVHRKRYDDWSLPKGKTEPGELLPVAAVREVLEEGGARLALGRRLVSVRYQVGGRPKRVHYWAARVASLDERAVPNSEVDEIAWVDAARAVEHVSYRHDHGVLADFTRLPAQTVPLILLRHAKAVQKSAWKHADHRRPLDDAGRADAKALAELLDCFAPAVGSARHPALITSPAARCVETLRPFAELSGAPLREEPSLYLHHQPPMTDAADSSRSLAALAAAVLAAGEPAIICAHRENLPHLQTAVLAALGIVLPASDAAPGSALASEELAPLAALPKDWADPLPTSGFWVLNLEVRPAPPAPPTVPAAPPTVPTAPPALTVPTAPAPSSASRRRWFGFRRRLRTAGPSPAPEPARPAPDPARPPAPRLISADRYDLTES
jgi:8-oxo-dGTP pyrophosphatase MutT (NUDIX family)/phosphohistidine phosphatase SixA